MNNYDLDNKLHAALAHSFRGPTIYERPIAPVVVLDARQGR